jgi:hypothetical protein
MGDRWIVLVLAIAMLLEKSEEVDFSKRVPKKAYSLSLTTQYLLHLD